MHRRYIALLPIACIILTSCSKSSTPETEPEPLPKTFAFTETNTLVKAAELEAQQQDKNTLKADFNKDGLSDMAIIKKEGDIQNKVDIYIRMKPDQPTQSGAQSSDTGANEPKYFKGGTIQRPAEGKITGIASAVDGSLVNIVILVTHSNAPNEWIHYRNDGNSFTEVAF